jgi:hypothetical protein
MNTKLLTLAAIGSSLGESLHAAIVTEQNTHKITIMPDQEHLKDTLPDRSVKILSRQPLLLQRLHLAVTSKQANPILWEAAKKNADIECKARAEAKRARKLAAKTK